jgi:hypothetical protein
MKNAILVGVLAGGMVSSSALATAVHIPVSARKGAAFINGNGLHGTGYYGDVNDLHWARMKASGPSNFTFMSRDMNFSKQLNGADHGGHTTIGQFLGSNGTMISNGAATRNFADTTYAYRGFISIKDPGQYDFYVRSDDGFELKIGGRTVSKFEGNRATATTAGWANFQQAGTYEFEMLYWNTGGPGNLVMTWARPNGGTNSLPGAGTIHGMVGKVVPISVLNKVVPTPGAVAAMALAGVVATRRRRAK